LSFEEVNEEIVVPDENWTDQALSMLGNVEDYGDTFVLKEGTIILISDNFRLLILFYSLSKYCQYYSFKRG
jgi:hypothetical protein